jgi:NAD(P)-dependent dehydrogenase (short-subunit alcohol dehydrogenase family)
MTITDKSVLVTGANRGIGAALVDEALLRGARRVYATTRRPYTHPDERVTPLRFDITDTAQIQQAVAAVDSLDVLINNAGILQCDDLTDRGILEAHLAVNLLGTYNVTQAFLPLVVASEGAVVNMLSVAAFAALPIMPAYSISKAALYSLTQSLRAMLAGRGVRVLAVVAGTTDTDMAQGMEVPKVSSAYVAQATFDALDKGDDEIFPHPMLDPLAQSWPASVNKAFERQFAAILGASL